MADANGPTAPPAPRPYLEFRPLLRTLGIASDARKLILATIGLVLLDAGWWGIAWAFGSPVPRSFELPTGPMFPELTDPSLISPGRVGWAVVEPFRTVVVPFASLFTPGSGPRGWFESALMGLWAVVVWGVVGGAIARIAVVQASGGHRVGLGTAVRFALGKSASLVGAPLTPMLAVALLAGGCALFGLLYRIPGGIGEGVAAVLGFVPLLLGLVMALILLGLALGWPLMHATVAAEGEDAPDALSRSYSYVNQRLARYAAHLVAALAIGTVGLLAAELFARVVRGLASWGVSLGAPAVPEDLGRVGPLFWEKVVGLLVHGWAYSYFWSAASIIYLILRRDVDGTAWHDVYLPEHDADTFAGDAAPAIPEKPSKAVEAEIA